MLLRGSSLVWLLGFLGLGIFLLLTVLDLGLTTWGGEAGGRRGRGGGVVELGGGFGLLLVGSGRGVGSEGSGAVGSVGARGVRLLGGKESPFEHVRSLWIPPGASLLYWRFTSSIDDAYRRSRLLLLRHIESASGCEA